MTWYFIKNDSQPKFLPIFIFAVVLMAEEDADTSIAKLVDHLTVILLELAILGRIPHAGWRLLSVRA